MTVRALSITPRFTNFVHCALISILLGISLLISACGGGGTTSAASSNASSSLPLPLPNSFTLSVSQIGSGTVTSAPSGINCGTSCSASYASGTSVSLTATAASGYTFSGWSGACAGTSTCNVSMTAARSVTATFSQNGVTNSTYIISWDPVIDPAVTGYKLYYANAPFSSGPQIHSIDVGSITSYEFTASTLGVSTGTTVYLAVTAVGGGTESPLSGTVSGVLQ